MPKQTFLALCAFSLMFSPCLQAGAASQEHSPSMTQDSELTLERLYAAPDLSGPRPRALRYAPDGSRVTFPQARPEESSRYDLWQFDVATGQQSLLVDSKLLEPDEVALSEAEKALRERKRIAGFKGIVSYDWGTDSTLLVPLGGDLFLVTLDAAGPDIRQLTQTESYETDARVSPNGRYVSFVREGAVYAIDLSDGTERRLTPLAEPQKAISYGVAEFVAQEEMDRYTGYWWSPDERYVAFTRVDESPVDIIPRFDIAARNVTLIEQRYPRAGRPNAIIDLFVMDLQTGKVHAVDWHKAGWGPATDQYLARLNWTKNGLIVQRVNRDQTEIDYQAFALPDFQTSDTLFTETQPRWVNLSYDVSVHDGRFRTSVESTGFRRLYVHQAELAEALKMDEGEWAIDAILWSGAASDPVFFTAYKDTPLERHLYKMPLMGGQISRMTEAGKSWTISMAPDGRSFIGTSSDPAQPPQTGLYRADGTLITWIEENRLDETHPYAPYLKAHTVPSYGTLTAEDGQTLYYSIQTPPDFDPARRYPVLVNVYGGPGVQTVDRDWERWDDQYYTRQGYIVFRLDNRGSAHRGKSFEDVIYRNMGSAEVADQLLGVAWLKDQDFVDPDRIAIQGWSYGGYMTLMTLLQAPTGTFAAAVAGAPVTDWSLYDTFYTERFMDTPQDNPEGYERASVFYHLDQWQGPLPELLLIHGMADDNVTFDNTTRLMAELQERGLMFDLMTYPGQRHGIRGEKLRTHLMRTRMRFLDRHLKNR